MVSAAKSPQLHENPPTLPRTGFAALPSDSAAAIGLPAALDPHIFEGHLEGFTRGFQPVGHIEDLLVRNLAREAAYMDLWNEGVHALLVEGARQLPALLAALGNGPILSEDLAFATAVSAPRVHLCEHHAQRRTRAFYRALHVLQQTQEERKAREQAGVPPVEASRFQTEEDCEQHLVKRFRSGAQRCLKCSRAEGHHLRSRKAWECAHCSRQTGLRTGTVMAESPLSLLTWFSAINLVLADPSIGAAELAGRLGIARVATARGMAKKIREAMAAEDASALLAGLDLEYAGAAAEPESGAPRPKKFRGGEVAQCDRKAGYTSTDAADGCDDMAPIAESEEAAESGGIECAQVSKKSQEHDHARHV